MNNKDLQILNDVNALDGLMAAVKYLSGDEKQNINLIVNRIKKSAEAYNTKIVSCIDKTEKEINHADAMFWKNIRTDWINPFMELCDNWDDYYSNECFEECDCDFGYLIDEKILLQRCINKRRLINPGEALTSLERSATENIRTRAMKMFYDQNKEYLDKHILPVLNK